MLKCLGFFVISWTLILLPQAKAESLQMISTIEITNGYKQSISLTEKENLRAKLVDLGVVSEEASLRILTLSPQEFRQLEKEVSKAQSGGSTPPVVIIMGIVLLLIMIIGFAERI